MGWIGNIIIYNLIYCILIFLKILILTFPTDKWENWLLSKVFSKGDNGILQRIKVYSWAK